MNSSEITNLETLLTRLPGIGPRSARRIALFLLKRRDTVMLPLRDTLEEVALKVQHCKQCGNLDTINPCNICNDPNRDAGIICVVEGVADLWALEKLPGFKGSFHVLGGLLSALDGLGPDELSFETLMERIEIRNVKEIILALPLTIDGQTTVHYIKNKFRESEILVTQLSQGVPVGGELDYLDDGTILTAILARRPV